MMTEDILQSQLEELKCMEKCDSDVLVAELKENQQKITSNQKLYYDEVQDQSWIEHYYCNISFEDAVSTRLFQALQKLVVKTHKYKHPYHISKDQYLYTWVDLQPNGQLKNIYSGIQKKS